jgi:hypothetical protein
MTDNVLLYEIAGMAFTVFAILAIGFVAIKITDAQARNAPRHDDLPMDRHLWRTEKRTTTYYK